MDNDLKEESRKTLFEKETIIQAISNHPSNLTTILHAITNNDQKSDESQVLNPITPTQRYTPKISTISIDQLSHTISSYPQHSENCCDQCLKKIFAKKNGLKLPVIFILSALLGASIVLGETNLERNFNEFKFTIAMISLMGLLTFFYYLFKTSRNRLNNVRKDYMKLLLSGFVGFILSYWITQIINAGPLFEQRISKDTAQWLYKTFHTNASTVMTSAFVLMGICFLVFAYAYCKRHNNHPLIQEGSFFSKAGAYCDTLCDTILSIFLLLIVGISISAITYGVAESLAQGWLNMPLSLIAITFWFSATCMFFLHSEYHTQNAQDNPRNMNNQAPQKGWPYYIGLVITFFILPMLAIVMTICQAGSQACTIHNVISSFIIPMFVVLMVVGIFESMPFHKNRGRLNPPLYNRNNQDRQRQQNEIQIDSNEKIYSDSSRNEYDDKDADSITPALSPISIHTPT